MIIETYITERKIADAKYDLAMLKATAAFESAYADMHLFKDQAELKVMTESGTIDDLAYYCEEATEGFVGRAKEVIMSIIEALKDFFSDLKTKIVKLFAGGDVTKTLDDLDKKIRLNPFAKNKKVKIPDFNKQSESMKDYDRHLGKLMATARAGSDVSVDDVEDAETDFNKKWIAASAAVVTITVVALIALSRKIQKSIENDVDSISKDTIGRMKSASDKVSEIADSEKVAVLTKITQKAAQNARKQSAWLVNTLVKCISILKTTFKNKDAFLSPGDTMSYEGADDIVDNDPDPKADKELEKDLESCDGCEDDCDDTYAASVRNSYDEFDSMLGDSSDNSYDDDCQSNASEVDSFVSAMDDASDDDDSHEIVSDTFESVDDLLAELEDLV